MGFYILYYAAALLLVLNVPLLVDISRNKDVIARRSFVLMPALFVYMLGMVRLEGVDIANYQYSYDGNYLRGGVPDIGFQILIEIFNTLFLPMQALFLFSGLVTVYSIQRLSRFFNVPFVILFAIFFLHLMVVRDFAQMRMGLAIAVAIIGLTSAPRIKLLLYIAAASVHLTSIVFIVAYEGCIWAANAKTPVKRWLILTMGLAGVMVVGANIHSLSFIDPRIELYLNWNKDGYGVEVASFGPVILQSTILIIGWLFRKFWQDTPAARALFFSQIMAIVCFLAFYEFAVFAFRFSNAISSLYPVFILLVLRDFRFRVGVTLIRRAATIIVLLFLFLGLLFRPGSYDIISKIEF